LNFTLDEFLDRGVEQVSVSYVEADHLFGKPVGKGLHTQEEQMVCDIMDDFELVSPSSLYLSLLFVTG